MQIDLQSGDRSVCWNTGIGEFGLLAHYSPVKTRHRNAVRFINCHVTTIDRRESNAAVDVLVTTPSIGGNVVLDPGAPTRITSLTKSGGKSGETCRSTTSDQPCPQAYGDTIGTRCRAGGEDGIGRSER